MITPKEVIKYSPATSNYPQSYLCDNIKLIVKTAFQECWLGDDFLYLLEADLTDLSSAENWIKDKSYSIDDLVCYDDCFYVSTCDDNTSHPANSKECWKEPNKFKSDCYNGLWDNCLKYYLAYLAYCESLPFATYQGTGKGAVKHKTENTESLSVKEMGILQGTLSNNAQRYLVLTFNWMVKVTQDETKDCNFLMVQAINDKCTCTPCEPPTNDKTNGWSFKSEW